MAGPLPGPYMSNPSPFHIPKLLLIKPLYSNFAVRSHASLSEPLFSVSYMVSMLSAVYPLRQASPLLHLSQHGRSPSLLPLCP